MSRIIIEEPESHGGTVLWKGRWIGRDGEEVEAFYEFEVPGDYPEEYSARPFLFVFLLLAMRDGGDLRIGGAVDERTLVNLMEWQRAFASVRSGLSVVELIPDEIGERFREKEGSLVAFSGGVDSSYSLFHPTWAREGARG